MQDSQCPACGAPVHLHSAHTALVVCEYCQSTLVNQGDSLKDVGKMAALIDDATPLQVGATGQDGDERFTIIGRIQYQYEHGVWNEWCLLLANQTYAWLSESNGVYVITRDVPITSGNIPSFDKLTLGRILRLNDTTLMVNEITQAKVVAGSGQLPFVVGAGYDAPVVDLSNDLGQFSTLDYSSQTPVLYVGRATDLNQLQMQGLLTERKQNVVKEKLGAFNCPSCGATLNITLSSTLAVACHSCHSVIDTQDKNYQILSQFTAAQTVMPRISMGTSTKVNGVEYTVLGFMRRSTQSDGETFFWDEYLIHTLKEGYAWLIESDGHWNFAQETKNVPIQAQIAQRPAVIQDHITYAHFEHYQASVDYVIGEFYWRIKVGDTVKINDYVADGVMLSQEMSKNEQTWSKSIYLDPSVIKQAFPTIELVERENVFANQPNFARQIAKDHWKWFMIFACVLLIAQLIFSVRTWEKKLEPKNIQISNTAQVQQVIHLEQATPYLKILEHAEITNSWLDIKAELVHHQTHKRYQASGGASYYAGVDEGESWSEGSKQGELEFNDLPAGDYTLDIQHQVGQDGATLINPEPIQTQLNIVYGQSSIWSLFFIALIALSISPFFAWRRSANFEKMRWYNSSYGLPPGTLNRRIDQ